MESEAAPVAADGFGEIVEPERAFNKPNFLPPQTSRKDFPPGLLGDVAWFFYCASPRPVKEIALATAIAFLAGVAGRAFNFSGAGLNQYIIVLAGTGRGKDITADGPDKLKAELLSTVPCISDFFGPTEIASGQALHKWLANHPSIICVLGEFGHTLAMMCDPRASTHLRMLKALLIKLYSKSGKNKVLGAMAYSDQSKIVDAVASASLTILCESNSQTVTETLDTTLVSEGLVSRFLSFEYLGPRVEYNESHFKERPSNALVLGLANMIAGAMNAMSRGEVVEVECEPAAKAIFDSYGKHCDTKINTSNDVFAELYNRGHLKAMKLAALAAVGCNWVTPIITTAQAQWACALVDHQICNLIGKFERNEVGSPDENEALREKCVVDEIAAYCRSEYNVKKYVGTTRAMHEHRVISERFLQQRFASKACFRRARIGATAALKKTLENMCRNGLLRNCSPHNSEKLFRKAAQSYQVSDSKAFGLELTNAFEGLFDNASSEQDAP